MILRDRASVRLTDAGAANRRRRLRVPVTTLHIALCLPALIVVFAVIGYPWLYSAWISLIETNPVTNVSQFAGLQNYVAVLQSNELLGSLYRTLWFSLLSAGGTTVAGLLIALVLNERFPGRSGVRTLVLLPWAVAPVVVGQMFQLLYDGSYGVLNGVLTQFGLIHNYIAFLADGQRALVLVALASVWSGAPLTALLLLASLQSIPANLYRAAVVDGAGVFARFFRVTLPSLRSMLLLVAIVNTVNALLAFDLIFVLTKGGPGQSTTVLSWWGYITSFQFGNQNQGSAILYVLSLFSLLASVAYFYLLRPRRRRATAAAVGTRAKAIRARRVGRVELVRRRVDPVVARRLRQAILTVCVALVVLWTAIPLYIAANASFSPERAFLSRPPSWFPWPPYFGNYGVALFGGTTEKTSNVIQGGLTALRNSFIVSAVVTVSNVLIGALAGYAFARNRGSRIVSGTLWVMMLTRMIPGLSLLVPLFVLFRSLGLVDSLAGLMIAYTGFTLPLVAWILKTYFESVPESLERAAMADGSSRGGALLRIIAPLSMPGIVAAAIFAFIVSWNQFVYPEVLTSSSATQTLPVVIAGLAGDQRIYSPAVIYAAGIVALIPPVFIAVALQRYLIRGLTAGAVKG